MKRIGLYEVDGHDVYVAENEAQAAEMHKEMYPDIMDVVTIVRFMGTHVLTYNLASIGGKGKIQLVANQWVMLISEPQHPMCYDW